MTADPVRCTPVVDSPQAADRWALVTLLLVACSLGCDSSDRCVEAAFAVQVDIQGGLGIAEQGVVVYWADQDRSAGTAMGTRNTVASLRREFATRAEAEAFHGRFVVAVAGEPRARASVDVAACDFVADIGHDPTLRAQAVFRYLLDDDGLLGFGSRFLSTPPLACTSTAATPSLEAAVRDGCTAGERHMLLDLVLDDPMEVVTFRRDGATIDPRMIGRWSEDAVVVELDLAWPDSGSPGDVSAEVSAAVAGGAPSSLRVGFDECVDHAERSGRDPATLLFMRQSLELTTAGLELDVSSGYRCIWSDGTGSGGIP